MTEKIFKCPKCGGSVSASSGTKIKTRYYHEKCYKEKLQEDLEKEAAKKERTKKKTKQKVEKPVEIPKAVSEDVAKQRLHFFEKIKELTGNKTLSAKTYVLADKYKKDYKNFTWLGMERTLTYVYELGDYEITDDIIGILPWKYSEANEYFETLEKVQPTEENLKDLYKRRKIKYNPVHEEKPIIDISQIGV